MSGSSRIPKLSLGILATGLAVTALSYAVPGADPLKNAVIVGGLGSLLQGLWTNLFTGDFAAHKKSLPKSAQDLYRNGHLETLYKNSIAACIESEKDDAQFSDTGIIRDLLASLHNIFEKDHGTEFIRALPELETAHVTDILHEFLSTQGRITTATPAAWRGFLDHIVGKAPAECNAPIHDSVARRLHTDFARALYERAKESAEKNPETFAGILLHFQSDTLSAITESARTIDDQLLPAVRSVVEGQTYILQLLEQNRPIADKIPALTALTDTFTAQVQQLQTNDHANADRYRKIADQLRAVKRRLSEIKDDTTAIREDVRQIKEDNTLIFEWLQQFQVQAAQKFPQGIPQNAPPFNIPKGAPKLFGRDHDLHALHQLYAEHHHIAITGVGGLGKTALCAKFLTDIEPPRAIFAHDFYQRPSLPSFISGILEQAGIPLDNAKLGPALCAIVLRQPDTLLYIEGAEKLDDVADLLRFIAPGTRLILTTRDPIHTEDLEEHRLHPLEEADAIQAIHYYADKKHRLQNRKAHPQPVTDDGWRLLARDMGGHPLGCKLTGEHCGRFALPPSAFHETLFQNGLRPLFHGADSKHNLAMLFRQTAIAVIANCKGSPNVAPAFVVRGLDPAFTSTEEDSHPTNDPTGKTDPDHSAPDHPNTDTIHPDERKSGVKPPHSKASRHPHAATESDAPANPAIIAWHALTLGGTNPVPLSILCELGVEGDDGLRALCDMAVATSHQVPSEQPGEKEPAYALIHALLGEWARTGLTEFGRPPETLLRPAMQWGDAMWKKLQHHRHVPGGPERYLLLHPIAEALLREIERIEPETPKEGGRPGPQRTEGEPIPVRTQGNHSVVQGAGTAPLLAHPITPTERYTFYYLLARMHELHGNHLGAEPVYRRALARMETDAPENSPLIAIALNNLAGLLDSINRLAEAEPLYRRALAIDEQSYGPHHPTVAISLNNLAGLLDSTNRRTEAEPLYRRVVDIFEQSYGANHPNVATALNNLAALLSSTNRLAEAEPLFRRALAIDEKSYGPHHPTVAIRLNNLAGLLVSTSRLAEAEPLYRRALAIAEQSYGPHHPTVATAVNNLAMLLDDTDRRAEAAPMYRRALLIQLRSFAGVPGVHSDVRSGVRNYVIASHEMGIAIDVWMPRVLEIFHEASISKEKMKEILDVSLRNE